MKPIRISAVSYLNTLPFVYGILSQIKPGMVDLQLDVPSRCAEKLRTGEADVALVPVGAIPEMEHHRIVTGFCIGAEQAVQTVLLLSRVPVDKIRSVSLDFDSRTSVRLVKVLARNWWHIAPSWTTLLPHQSEKQDYPESIVAIGDKTFDMIHAYPYAYDLAEEWIRFCGLPFVFAVWMAGRDVSGDFLSHFNDALAFGVANKERIPDVFAEKIPPDVDAIRYLREHISFELTPGKREGMAHFLRLIKPDD